MKGWQTKRLGDLFVFKNGRAFKKEEWATHGLPIIRIQNLNNVDAPFNYFAGEYSRDILIEPGDLMFSWSGTVGSSFGSHLWDREPGVLNQHIFKIGLRDNLDKRYAFHALRQITAAIEESVNGAVGLVHITKEKLNEFTIPVPPLSEQQRIVGVLDEAFAGLATAEAHAAQNLQNARALFESHLQAVFTQRGPGWVEKRIEEWCDSIMDCVNKTAPVVEGPTPFKMIRTTNVRHGRVDVTSVKYVTEETYKIWTRRQTPQKGDVILTREAPMGEVGMLLTDDRVFLGQRLVSYRANSAKLDNKFLLFALRSGDLQGQIHAKASGSTVQHMRVPDTKNLLLAAPPLAQQRAIVSQIDALSAETQRLAGLYQRKRAALGALKKSLLHQAFAGEL